MKKDGPFRPKPWPLEQLRRALRRFRLYRIGAFKRFRFTHGDNVSFAGGADVRPPSFLELSSFISFGKNFTCEANLTVGSHVLISSNVSVIGKDHPFDDPEVTVYEASRLDEAEVQIGSNVLIGFGTIIIGSVKIGDGCIVGAGSVVTKDLAPGFIYVGSPARPLRPRFQPPEHVQS